MKIILSSYVNAMTPMTYQSIISPCNADTVSSRQVRRISIGGLLVELISIPRTNSTRIVRQTVRKIINEILAVKGLRLFQLLLLMMVTTMKTSREFIPLWSTWTPWERKIKTVANYWKGTELWLECLGWLLRLFTCIFAIHQTMIAHFSSL